MVTQENCVRISPDVLNIILSEVKKDAFIMKNRRGFHGRFIKNDKRFSNTEAFSTPLIGYLRGQEAYVKASILSYYSPTKVY